MDTQLVVLPNKDLWRGHSKVVASNPNMDISPGPRPFAKLDEALAAIMKASAGAKELTCTWCGLQMDVGPMREHLKKNHASVVEPPTDEQIVAASKAAEIQPKK